MYELSPKGEHTTRLHLEKQELCLNKLSKIFGYSHLEWPPIRQCKGGTSKHYPLLNSKINGKISL